MSYRVLLSSVVKKDAVENLFPFLVANLPNVRGFKGCLNVTVLFDEATRKMVFDEEWISVEAHKNYIEFISNNGVLADLAGFIEAPPAIEYYKRVEI